MALREFTKIGTLNDVMWLFTTAEILAKNEAPLPKHFSQADSFVEIQQKHLMEELSHRFFTNLNRYTSVEG